VTDVVDIEKKVDWGAMLLLLKYGEDEQAALAEALYNAKVMAYEEAVMHEARRMGFDVSRDQVSLANPQTKSHLRKQARLHAGYIVNTHNADLTKHLSELEQGPTYPLRNRFQLAQDVDKWARERFTKRMSLITTTESFTPLMRGTIDFYRQNGIETDFTFHAEPGACSFCKRLLETNPHPLRKVMRIGIPHPNCAHSWAPTIDTLPASFVGDLWLGGAYRSQEDAA
jgi:hypothetical protein